MPHACAAFNCTARLKKGQNLKFHSFPKDEKLRQQWVKAVGRIDFNPSSSSKICSNHFQQHDYFINVHGTKTLKKGAVPSIFSFLGHPSETVNVKKSHPVYNDIEGVSSLISIAEETRQEEQETEQVCLPSTSSAAAMEDAPPILKSNIRKSFLGHPSETVNVEKSHPIYNDIEGVSSLISLAEETRQEEQETEQVCLPSTSSTAAMEDVPPILESNIRKRESHRR